MVGWGWQVKAVVDLVDSDRFRQVHLGVPQVELEVFAVLRQARIVRAGAVRRDLSRGHRARSAPRPPALAFTGHIQRTTLGVDTTRDIHAVRMAPTRTLKPGEILVTYAVCDPSAWRLAAFATKTMPTERELSILAAGATAAASLLVLAHRRRQGLICQPCDVADDVEMKGGVTLLTPPRDAGTQRTLGSALS